MKCPNCGAQVPASDLFCGECGSRVVSEEKPTTTPPSPALPPAEKSKKGLPKGLLIGCGGLLALAVVAACIFGAVTLFNGLEPTPTLTPTQIVQKPTNAPTPVPLPSATPTEVAPTFELVAFAPDVTDDDEPINPGTTFPAGTTKVYTIFNFSGMKDGVTYDAYWYRDGQEELHKSWEWSLGENGTSWVNIFNDDGLTSGNYELKVYVGEQLFLSGQFTIEAGFTGTVSNVRFALTKSDDDLPLGIGDVFPYGITEVYVFFDYANLGAETDVESTWLRDGQTEASGAVDLPQESGDYRIRFYNDEPLLAGNYEWQLTVAGTKAAGGSFSIVEPLLFDDFGDPTSGWSEEADAESSQGYRDGTYFINVSTTDLAVWSTAGHTFDDFTLQVDARQMAGDQANEYGVLFRYVDNVNFYSFDVTGDGTFALFKLENKEWSTLVNWQESAYLNPLGELNHLQVACRGNRITLYANDQELISVTDDSFSRGDVGLFAGTFNEPGVEAVFDNVIVMENR
jgi:DNA-directed RNA polymerase subunit RPC12/RpoP